MMDDKLLPPNTRPIPLQGNAFTLTESVRETAILAVSFAEDFERLLELYQVVDYDIYVRSTTFTLNHSQRNATDQTSRPSVTTEDKTQGDKPQGDKTETFFLFGGS